MRMCSGTVNIITIGILACFTETNSVRGSSSNIIPYKYCTTNPTKCGVILQYVEMFVSNM